VKCLMHNCGRGYEATMMALEEGIVWGADVVVMQRTGCGERGIQYQSPRI